LKRIVGLRPAGAREDDRYCNSKPQAVSITAPSKNFALK
jgi:hypothetical protein